MASDQNLQIKGNLIWSPTRNFDIGVEAMWGRVNASLQNPTAAFVAAGQPLGYRGYYGAAIFGEGMQYTLEDSPSGPRTVCLNYTGAFPVYATNENTTNLKTEAPPSLQFKPNNIHGIEEEEKDEPKQELGENTPLKPLRDVDQPKDNETRKKKRQDSVKEMAIDAPMQAPKPTFVSEVSFEILAET